eukprot:XP_003725394.2 PREDICTED: collagen alpha-1(X) chain [Strongylocentrotus purpuratus]
MGTSREFRLLAAFLILASQHIIAEQDVPSVSSPNYNEQPESERPVIKPEVNPIPEVNTTTGGNPNPDIVSPSVPEVQPVPDNVTPDAQPDPQQVYRDYLQNYLRENCQKASEPTHIPGPPGPPGYPGPTGVSGPAGMPGSYGNNGINGLSGRDGLPGERGAKGEQGYPGLSGTPGMPGLRGDEGPRGPQGSDGSNGRAGAVGKNGTPGRIGPQGDQGFPGVEGQKGSRGYKGDDGEPGVDGVCNCDPQPQQRNTPASGTSAFSVARTSGLTATDGPVTVTFQHVFVNVHDDFDINTGKFNCSLPGLYFFTINVYKSSTTNFPLVQILLNGDHQAAVIDYGSTDTEDSATNSIILSLNYGDEVWLQLYDGRELYSSHYRFTTFSGFRIG